MKTTIAKKWKGLRALIALIVMQITVAPCIASIPRTDRQINLGFMNRCHDFRTAEDYSTVPMVRSLREMNQQDIASMIPASSLKDNESGGRVAGKILAHSLNSFFKSEAVQNSSVGRTAVSVERAMDTSVTVGEGPTKHSLNFKMKATDARAVLKYEGFARAQVSYQVTDEHELKFSMFQSLNKQAQVVFDAIAKRDDQIQQVSLNLSF